MKEDVRMHYKIRPIFLGQQGPLDLSMLIHRLPPGQHVMLNHGCFAIECNGETILVDTGIPTTIEAFGAGMRVDFKEDNPIFLDALQENGIKLELIKKVILTHLHWDHCWNVEKLPNATFYVQKQELYHAITPLPHERGPFGCFENSDGPKWFKVFTRIEVVDGDVELQPGIRLITTPGHTLGSQSVLVDTDKGVYGIVGDFAYTMRNYTERVIVGQFVSGYDWYNSHRKLKALNLKDILTTHGDTTYSCKIYG
jgi:glyoxylase-like metal-dependent hydrolase (beta-lactamase superfamily II)